MGWGGGDGKGSGQRKLPARIPSRGGGDWGKKMRQEEQAMLKDAKSNRESDYFWQTQARLGTSPPYAKNKYQLAQEEKEIFGSHDGNVGINFDKYDDIPVEMSGSGSEKELNNIERCNYSRPTPIQKYAVPTALSGSDCMCCAQTGSGKTCAFLLPIMASIEESTATGTVGVPAAPQAIVIAPTRELCSQIHLEARKLSFNSKIRCSEIYGGVEAKPQLRELALGSDIVTCTPGRLSDFINRGVITMSSVYYLVLDEADRMLDMGFEPQIREIVQRSDMPSPQDGRMTLMFSATFPREIQRLAQAFMRQYIWISVGRVGGTVDSVEQEFVHVDPRRKQSEVTKLLRDNASDVTLVFVAMKRTAASLVETLNRSGFYAVAIHGDMEQPERERSLSQFRSGQCTILVATDVCARGLDIPKVNHVINYDLPENIEDYVHRIGRTGRIGRSGYATSFYVSEGNWNNHKILRGLIEQFTSKEGAEVPELLKEMAQEQGIRIGGKGKGGRNNFGGNDHRGGAVHHHKVSSGGGKSGGKGGKGKGGDKGSGKRDNYSNQGGGYRGGDNGYRGGGDNGNRGDNGYRGGGGGNNGYNHNGNYRNNGYDEGGDDGASERPKLQLKPRTLPLEGDRKHASNNGGVFGNQRQPVGGYGGQAW
eukprot:CAMPEP_0169425422 /NCGR_PEP_ID=MMETSP1017-20121227/68559_1 /TAXON_ID=342587 /ORGANISM="Karlodinium micrum, Strain CCMP2283" /LENGTH=649 /DNA_ID=CAMNT_0009535259 /DNA_START=72 /DNA_END=2019 /DNA_ORIENTATION=+